MDVSRLLPALLVTLLALPATAGAVTGGQDASRPYPHMAAFEYQFEGSDEYEFVCGASLIAPNKILTAAHCVMDDRDGDMESEVVPPQTVRFLIGTQTLSQRSAGETIGAQSIEVFPNYLEDFQGDVAIVTLAHSATKGSPIRLANPATEKPLWAPGKGATVIGWGVAFFGDPGLTVADKLQEVGVPMVADDTCDTAYFLDDPIRGDFYAEWDVCAGEDSGMKDACQGDSGGPLMVPDATGALVLVGTVSRGFGCGYPNSYGVYARAADTNLYNWIAARAPQGSAPAPTTSSGGGGSTGDGGSTTSSPPSGSSTPPPSGSSGSSRTTRFQRCMRRADRIETLSGRRRARQACRYALQRRRAYRRCIRRGTAPRKCRAQRRAAARRHARRLRAMR